MQTEIQILNNEQFGDVRMMMDENGEPLFCASDVCKALGYVNSRDALRKHVDSDDVAKHGIIDSMGRTQHTSFINESGLFSLIFESKLPQARQFRRWVTREVLPQIRKTGGYIPLSPAKEYSEDEIVDIAKRILQNTLEYSSQMKESQRNYVDIEAEEIISETDANS